MLRIIGAIAVICLVVIQRRCDQCNSCERERLGERTGSEHGGCSQRFPTGAECSPMAPRGRRQPGQAAAVSSPHEEQPVAILIPSFSQRQVGRPWPNHRISEASRASARATTAFNPMRRRRTPTAPSGATQYVQWVNEPSRSSTRPPAQSSPAFPSRQHALGGFGGNSDCETNNDGDPIVAV